MSRELTRSDYQKRLRDPRNYELSFAEKVKAALATKGLGTRGFDPQGSCLLLDTSGSMNDGCGSSTTRIGELRNLADEFKGVRRFRFASDFEEMTPEASLPFLGAGGTSMHRAFDSLKRLGIVHCVMITDGRPDDPGQALKAARGLKIDVFYVGPDPAPQFLRDLAKATGGQYSRTTLDLRKELATQVRLLLTDGKPGGGGTIAL